VYETSGGKNKYPEYEKLLWCNINYNARFEVLVVVKIQVKFFCVVIICSVVVGYQHFRGPCCIHFLVENGSKVL
jgi:hypothetical protein